MEWAMHFEQQVGVVYPRLYSVGQVELLYLELYLGLYSMEQVRLLYPRLLYPGLYSMEQAGLLYPNVCCSKGCCICRRAR